MSVLDRFVIAAVLKGVFLVLLILISLGTVFEFMRELPDVGTARYSLNVAVAKVALQIPALAVILMPAAALIGALLETEALSGESSTRQIAGFSTISLKPCSTGPTA